MPWIDHVAGRGWKLGIPELAGARQSRISSLGVSFPPGSCPLPLQDRRPDLPHERIFGATVSSADGDSSGYWVADDPKRPSFAADYNEGARFGYKWFDSQGRKPLFPFGYGLSYTKFKYSGLHVDRPQKP